MTRTRKLARPYWILALLIALSAVLGAAALRAAAQSLMAPPAALGAAEASPAVPPRAQAPATQAATPAPPDAATPGTPTKSAPPAAPAGVIRDDPTLAPDKGQSADNNVSFPVDI